MTLDAISARTGAVGLLGEFYGQINRCQSDSTTVKFSTNRPKADSWLMEGGFQKNEVLHSKVEAAHPSRDLQRLPEWGLWRGSGPTAWFLSVLCFLGFSAGLEAQVDLPSSFYDTTVYWSSGFVRFNQVGSNRVEGAASSTALTWAQEEDSIPGMSAGFSVSTKNIDVESHTINIACGRYFYIESQSQQPVSVQMTVKGNLHIDYMAALKPDRNMEHGYFCGLMRGRISGNRWLEESCRVVSEWKRRVSIFQSWKPTWGLPSRVNLTNLILPIALILLPIYWWVRIGGV